MNAKPHDPVMHQETYRLPEARTSCFRSTPLYMAFRAYHSPPQRHGRITVTPDCGMKYRPRDMAYGKLKAMADSAVLVRKELRG